MMARKIPITLILPFIVFYASCGPDDRDCPPINGSFKPFYAKQTGTCEEFESYDIDIKHIPVGTYTDMMFYFNHTIKTEFMFDVCALEMKQEVNTRGVITAAMEGVLFIDSAEQLSGWVDRVEYDDNGFVVCAGTYDVMLEKRTKNEQLSPVVVDDVQVDKVNIVH